MRRGSHQAVRSFIRRQSGSLFGASVTAALTGFLFWVAAASTRSAAEVGLLAVAAPIGYLAGIAVTAGLGSYVLIALPRRHPSGRKRLSIVVTSSAVVIAAPTGILAAALLGLAGPGRTLVVLTAPLVAATVVLDGIDTAEGRAGRVVLRNIYFGALRFVLLVVTAIPVDAIWIVSLAASILLTLPRFRCQDDSREFTEGDRSVGSQELGSIAWHHAAAVLSGLPVHLAPWLIAGGTDDEAAGAFYLALQMTLIISSATTAVTSAAMAQSSRREEFRLEVIRLARQSTWTIIPIIAAIVVITGSAVLNWLGSPYSAVTGPLLILAISQALATPAQLSLMEGRMSGRHGAMTAVYGVSTVVAVGFMVVDPTILGVAIGLSAGRIAATLLAVGIELRTRASNPAG